ncbi:hypothetical protein [Nocardia bovistercoris]|uniref:Uncharacterized protein n=1 Tax=Nocardia bovistercoris TaxID=2785916 RepID=A0A931N024_9NOCA|nr:hypothetical protein [Nocardia bovistercoris]MBH0776780.1 hypothetical protein [Nocardia bovistercoris]
MELRKTLLPTASHEQRYDSAVLSLSLAVVVQLATIAALVTSILATVAESSVAATIVVTGGGYVLALMVGLVFLRGDLRRRHRGRLRG